MFKCVIEKLLNLNGKYQILMYLSLFNEGTLTEQDLKSNLRISSKTLRKCCAELVSKGHITTRIDDKGIAWYFINLSHYNSLLKRCVDCKSVAIKDGFTFCKNKHCVASKFFNNEQKAKNIKKRTKGYMVLDVTKNTGMKKGVENWGIKEFVNHIKLKYKAKFPGISFPINKVILEQQINEMIIVIKRLVGNNQYPLYCKRHVDYLLGRLKNSDDFNVKNFTDIKEIKNTLLIKDKKSTKKKLSANNCERYGIKCDYWNGSCTLERDKIGCSKETRQLMIGKYDI